MYIANVNETLGLIVIGLWLINAIVSEAMSLLFLGHAQGAIESTILGYKVG